MLHDLQVHISHIGEMKFKGVADPQSVVQFSTAHLAARQFSQEPPSAKAELVSDFSMRLCVITPSTMAALHYAANHHQTHCVQIMSADVCVRYLTCADLDHQLPGRSSWLPGALLLLIKLITDLYSFLTTCLWLLKLRSRLEKACSML